MNSGEVMTKKTTRGSDEMSEHAKDYVAYQTVRDLEERNLERGFDAAFRVRNKDGRLVLASRQPKHSQNE